MNFSDKLACYSAEFNGDLKSACEREFDKCRPEILSESIGYSLMLGGKRIRPVLAYAVGDMLGVERRKIINFAVAIEFIHTYSLIHDDLPEMDNDDFRRGKPANHKKFGTGNAVLAGDGLLNTAYLILLRECRNGEEYISAAEYICECAGVFGMIAGQSADLLHENDGNYNEPVLNFIYENKTAKLLMAPVVVPAILGGGKYFAELKSFGKDLGYLFQLTDDILDVEGDFSVVGKSIGKDSKEGKYTAVNLFGLDGAKLYADILCGNCKKLLEGLPFNTEFLMQLVDYVRTRTK